MEAQRARAQQRTWSGRVGHLLLSPLLVHLSLHLIERGALHAHRQAKGALLCERAGGSAGLDGEWTGILTDVRDEKHSVEVWSRIGTGMCERAHASSR